jgi:hypothetical protein
VIRRIGYGIAASAAVLLASCDFGEAGVVRCQEDEVAVVAPDSNPNHGLTWVCVVLDDFADADSIARLDAILAERNNND